MQHSLIFRCYNLLYVCSNNMHLICTMYLMVFFAYCCLHLTIILLFYLVSFNLSSFAVTGHVIMTSRFHYSSFLRCCECQRSSFLPRTLRRASKSCVKKISFSSSCYCGEKIYAPSSLPLSLQTAVIYSRSALMT